MPFNESVNFGTGSDESDPFKGLFSQFSDSGFDFAIPKTQPFKKDLPSVNKLTAGLEKANIGIGLPAPGSERLAAWIYLRTISPGKLAKIAGKDIVIPTISNRDAWILGVFIASLRRGGAVAELYPNAPEVRISGAFWDKIQNLLSNIPGDGRKFLASLWYYLDGNGVILDEMPETPEETEEVTEQKNSSGFFFAAVLTIVAITVVVGLSRGGR